jgi:hypothetical protein
MPDTDSNPPWKPPCNKCDKPMRLVGIEADEADARHSLHTYVCECGETLAFAISKFSGKPIMS